MISALAHDLRFAVRHSRRRLGFVLATSLTLALGIGSATAIFSLVDGILQRPLPFPHPEQLVALSTLEFPPGVPATDLSAANYMGTSYPDYFDWRRDNHSFQSLASCEQTARLFAKTNGEGTRVIRTARVSASLFATLGVRPALGRDFSVSEEAPGHRVIILSHELWLSDFAGSKGVLGQTVNVSDEPHMIIGVMPAGFHYPVVDPAFFWTTFSASHDGVPPLTSRRDDSNLGIVGRMKPGVAIPSAQAEMTAIERRLALQFPEDRNNLSVDASSLIDAAVWNVRPTLTILSATVGVVLLIACTNVAGLLLGSANQRRPEFAVRAAIGANRRQILRQLLLEALCLALAGGAAGIVLGFILLRIGVHFVPGDLPRLDSIAINGRVLTFALVLSSLTALIFGLFPAWRISRLDPIEAIREGGPSVTAGRRRNRLGHALVVAEIALGFVLLIGAGLLIRSFVNVLHVESGFDTEHTLSFGVSLTNKRYPDPAKVAFFDKLLPMVGALPGVEAASGAHPLPLDGGDVWTHFTIPGHLDPPENPPTAMRAVAEPGYFETLSIPLLRGRTFKPSDDNSKAAPVTVVNRSFVQQFFPNEDAIGRYLVPQFENKNEAPIPRQIIGIVGDTRSDDPVQPTEPEFFVPYAQNPTHQRPVVVLRVAGDPGSYENTVRAVVASLDKGEPIYGYRTFRDKVANSAAQQRFEAQLVSAFAVLALFLAGIGMYAVLSYIVSQQTRELGLRMAFGARRSQIMRLVLGRSMFLAAAGIGLGTFAAFFVTQFFADVLFRVRVLDPAVFVSVAFVLFIVAILSAVAPALRAAYVNPMSALREQ